MQTVVRTTKVDGFLPTLYHLTCSTFARSAADDDDYSLCLLIITFHRCAETIQNLYFIKSNETYGTSNFIIYS